MSKKKGLHPISGMDSVVTRVLRPMYDLLEGWMGLRGSKLDQVVTRRDLVESGLASVIIDGRTIATDNPSGDVISVTPGDSVLSLPGPVKKLTAVGSFAIIHLTWDAPSYKYISRFNVYRSTTDNFVTATKIGSTSSTQYADEIGKGTGSAPYYYWVRVESIAGKEGPLQSTAGVQGRTSYDSSYLLSTMTIKWEANTTYANGSYVIPSPASETGLWYRVISPTSNSGSVEPVWGKVVGDIVFDGALVWQAVLARTTLPVFQVGEVGGVRAVIMNTAYIGDASIESAKIGSLVADKITTGNLTATINMTSGLIRTAVSGYRVEMDNAGYPIWYGNGAKSDANGLFFVKPDGTAKVGGWSIASGNIHNGNSTLGLSNVDTDKPTIYIGSPVYGEPGIQLQYDLLNSSHKAYFGTSPESYLEIDSQGVKLGQSCDLQGAAAINNSSVYYESHFDGGTSGFSVVGSGGTFDTVDGNGLRCQFTTSGGNVLLGKRMGDTSMSIWDESILVFDVTFQSDISDYITLIANIGSWSGIRVGVEAITSDQTAINMAWQFRIYDGVTSFITVGIGELPLNRNFSRLRVRIKYTPSLVTAEIYHNGYGELLLSGSVSTQIPAFGTQSQSDFQLYLRNDIAGSKRVVLHNVKYWAKN